MGEDYWLILSYRKIKAINLLLFKEQNSAVLQPHPAKQDFIAERFHLRSRFLPSLTDFIAPLAPVCRSRQNLRKARRMRLHSSARTARFRIRGMRCRFAVDMFVKSFKVCITAKSTPLQGAKKDNRRPLYCYLTLRSRTSSRSDFIYEVDFFRP